MVETGLFTLSWAEPAKYGCGRQRPGSSMVGTGRQWLSRFMVLMWIVCVSFTVFQD